ncbi:MAG: FAD:protein FMN transferase [Chthoniobacteraceae bacterium]
MSEVPNFFFPILVMAAWLGGTTALRADERFVFEKAEMGVPFRITLYAADEAAARAATDAAFERVEVLNSILSDYDPDSELSRLSHTSGRAIPVSGDLWKVLTLSQRIAELSDGAFDITIGPLVNLWRRARRMHELPAPELIAEMRARVGFHRLRLDPTNRTAELLAPDMRLDVGGIAKGYAVDEALRVLRTRGIERALVAASGDIGASGPPPDQPGWRIEVAALDAEGAPPAQLVWLNHSAVSTSGDTFQRVEIDGVRYSHIVDPRTGLGITDHSLVTVLGPNCTTTDSWETTITILGPERGLKIIAEIPDTAVHIVRKPGAQIEVYDSPRWKELAGPQPR